MEQFDIEKRKIDDLKGLILTSEQYKHTPYSQGKIGRSYVFEILNNNKKITYFGAWHTNDPDDPQFKEIEDRFKESKPDIVYIEGWPAINQDKDAIRADLKNNTLDEMKLAGESHFTLKLAIDNNVDFESPEPDFSHEINYLLEKDFSKKDIFMHYMYREIDQYQRQTENRNIEECKKYLKPYFDDFRKASGWAELELEILEEDVLSELDVDNMEKYSDQVDPIPWDGKTQTVINEISRYSNYFRDQYIFERIVEGLKKYDKLFVVYGSGHVVQQEPALRALLKS